MDYLVSARKWRPQAFEEVIGQQHVARTLTNAIRQGRIAHAYLFSGGRGVGKTTMARIMAKSLNCQSGPIPKPCQSCPACQAITAGHSPDVIEIDGASNRGIDEVRELREMVKYTPMQGHYRVYIIDEVHMLTKEAFNALLKILEEPPAHVVFIMATTEVHKIPSTILSRCQHFQFRRMTRQETIGQLQEVAKKEGISLTALCAAILAKVADGSMRDALSLLDQAAAYSGKVISETDLQSMLGTPSRDILTAMAQALLERQTATALSIIKTVLDQGCDLKQFASELVGHWRNLLIAKLASDPAALLDLLPEEVTILCQAVVSVTEEELQRFFGIFAQALEMLRTAPHPRFILEMAVIKATQLPPLQSVEQLLERLEQLEKGLSAGSPPLSPAPALKPNPQGTPPSPLRVRQTSQTDAWGSSNDLPAGKNSMADSEPNDPALHLRWEDVIRGIREKKPGLASYLEKGTIINMAEDAITLGYPGNADFLVDLIQKEENQQVIKGMLAGLFGHSVDLKLTRLPSKSQPPKQAKQSLKQEQIRQEILSHPMMKEALDIFGGEIIEIQEPSSQ